MSAIILRLPLRGRFDIRVEREADSEGWLVLTRDRQHGWLHGDFDGAQQDAGAIARGYGVAVVSSAGRRVP
jgi:hypothetical protein